jgi:hypothetical protein
MLSDARFRNYHLQRQVLEPPTREQHARRAAAALPPAAASERPEIEALATQGYAMTPGLISPGQVADMRGYFANHECTDEYRPHLGNFLVANVPEPTHVAIFEHDCVAAAPHALKIANDPAVLEIVGAALGAKPTISVMSAWWSLPHGDAPGEQAQLWHRDVDDWRFLKLFVYLTDVDEDAGPHVYLPASHSRNTLMRIRRYEDSELETAFPDLKPHRFTGPAGTMFLENTFGFHRGYPPRTSPRLIFQVTYSMRPLVHGPKEPVARLPGGLGYDPYVTRVYFSA